MLSAIQLALHDDSKEQDTFATNVVPMIQALISDNVQIRGKLLALCQHAVNDEEAAVAPSAAASCHNDFWQHQTESFLKVLRKASSKEALGSAASSSRDETLDADSSEPSEPVEPSPLAQAILELLEKCSNRHDQLMVIDRCLINIKKTHKGRVYRPYRASKMVSNDNASDDDSDKDEPAEPARKKGKPDTKHMDRVQGMIIERRVRGRGFQYLMRFPDGSVEWLPAKTVESTHG